MKANLKDFCVINDHINKNEFVGITFKYLEDNNIEPRIYFPLGFKESLNNKELREDIRLLIKTLSNRLKDEKHNKSNYSLKTEKIKNNSDFPLGAYIFILREFFTRGYYNEFENTYKISTSGKINFSRTMKTQKPYICDDEVYYLKFMTRSSEVKNALLITQIHKYFVYEAYNLIGWLFNINFNPQKPSIKFNKKFFINAIKDQLSHTFNDKNRELFKNMLYILDNTNENNIKTDLQYGTDNFEYAWENLIDFTYGINNKEYFFPKGAYYIDGKKYDSSVLRPDSIMEFDNDIFILDAKYYKYGISQKSNDLPDTSSISKQIFYGEYAKNKYNNKNIYNAFIIPFCNIKENYKIDGYAKLENDSSEEKFKKIAVVLIDMKFLMKQEIKYNDKEIYKLSKLIQDKIDNC